MTHPAPESKPSQEFMLQMYRAEQDAARQGFPVCPTRFERVVVDDVAYGIHISSRGGASKTVKLDAQVTNLDTGRSFAFEGIIRKLLVDTASYCLPRQGTWKGRPACLLGLAELAAPRTQALVFHNPVTGPAFVGVSL